MAAMLAFLFGCASTETSSYHNLVETTRLAMHRARPGEPTAASVQAKPFFQLRAVSPDGQAVMNLGGDENGFQGWYGNGGDAIFLEHGQIVRTIGLRQNLDDSRWPDANPFAAGLQTLGASFDGERIIDWSPGYRYGLSEKEHLTVAGMEDVTILGTIHHLRRIDERVSVPAVGFTAENHYWVDPADGFVWKSQQVVAPGLRLDLTELKPYRKNAP